jgi:hypothetical protein
MRKMFLIAMKGKIVKIEKIEMRKSFLRIKKIQAWKIL